MDGGIKEFARLLMMVQLNRAVVQSGSLRAKILTVVTVNLEASALNSVFQVNSSIVMRHFVTLMMVASVGTARFHLCVLLISTSS